MALLKLLFLCLLQLIVLIELVQSHSIMILADDSLNLVCFQRFVQYFSKPNFLASIQSSLVRVGSQSHNSGRSFNKFIHVLFNRLKDFFSGFEPIHLRHLQVHDYQFVQTFALDFTNALVWCQAACEKLNCFQAVCCFVNLDSLLKDYAFYLLST